MSFPRSSPQARSRLGHWGRRAARVVAASALAVPLLVTGGTASAAQTGALVSAASARCLDVAGNVQTAGTGIQIWDCNGQANQQWTVTDAGELRVFGGSMCLDAGQSAAGTKLQIQACTGAAKQKFTLRSDGSIYGAQSGLCADVNAAATANGTTIQLWGCHGQANQRWTVSGGSNPPGGTCSASPVNPRATAQAKKLLCYFYSQYGNHIISGQEESTWVAGSEYEMNYIRDRTGKYPAIRGMDIEQDGVGGRGVSWWNAGGIPMVGYHMGAPTKPDTYEGSQMAVSINAVLTPGTAEYASFTQRLDKAAAQLQIMENAGVPVLWRPFHEAGGTWFWWSKEGGSQYKRLWQFEYNYFTTTKGLDNLVWLLPFNGQPSSSFYPGKSFVDIAGSDTYAGDYGPQTSLFNATRNIVGGTIPIALHENGPIPDPDQLQSSNTRWVMFNTWHTDWLTNTSHNSISQLQKTYNSSYVVTRDEVPNLK